MICPRCRTKMSEQKRSFHKRRKWICRHCGLARMQEVHRGTRRLKNPPS